MAFTGISPQASVFGNEQSEGILVAKTDTVDAPGGFIFATNVAGTIQYYFIWVSAAGALRIIVCTPGVGVAALYDPGTNQMTFTAFDQATSGALV